MNRPLPYTPLVILATLALLTVAQAQATLPGVPTAYAPIITLVVSLLSGLLVKPLTAIVKKLGGTSGVTTVAISAVLSLLIVAAINVWQGIATQQGVAWPTALLMALVAFVQANGAYLAQVAAAVKGAQVAARTGELSYSMPEHDLGQVPGFQPDPGPGMALPAGAQPLLGLPDLSSVGALLGSPVLESVVKMALTAAGLGAGKGELLAVGYKLAQLAPDLLDGNSMLSTHHLNIINGVVLDLKAEYRGGSK